MQISKRILSTSKARTDKRRRPVSYATTAKAAAALGRPLVLFGALAALAFSQTAEAQDTSVLNHHVVGARLRVSPEVLHIPKDIRGSLHVDLTTASGLAAPELDPLRAHTHVEAVLRGPGISAYQLLGRANEPLMLPPLALKGEYSIDDIRLVDTQTGETLIEGNPSRIPVHVFQRFWCLESSRVP